MNPRILKKLSARAAPFLPLLGDRREQFRAEGDGNYHSVFMPERDHWERSPCHPSCEPWNLWSTPRGMPIRVITKAGRHLIVSPPHTPLRGTIMVGGMSGYYEPEWDEETAYEALVNLLMWHFAEYDPEIEDMQFTRSLGTPHAVFEAAHDAVADVDRRRS